MTYEHAVFALCFKLVVSSCALSIVLDVGSMVWRTCFDTLCVLFDHAMVLTYKLSITKAYHLYMGQMSACQTFMCCLCCTETMQHRDAYASIIY